ncbi:osmotically inducible protein C [Kosmotoga arenicorallina S304]|uniref:Osmotically inducible protein C n=1 Tax=Kosmotoga arenicorallina S304 TaxID=1453497 RepID=A0A176K315_9BACT|nr:osmotically inducible protein C [Kosmotoga arenicorallina S304]
MKLKRIGNMAFHTKTPSGHDVHVDAGPEVGGNDSAPRPKELMLISLLGCTSMDVVSILNKMKVKDYDYEITAEGQIASEHPKVFTSIKLTYKFKGKNLPKEKIEKAVSLSQERYCFASAMLKKACSLSYEITYEEV